ncbi:MAG: hypothetical protein HW392_1585 [Steroidobacteraceae bacterium]|nr:hypothetical protein [Steroidobacteraceae bacterium]
MIVGRVVVTAERALPWSDERPHIDEPCLTDVRDHEIEMAVIGGGYPDEHAAVG